MTKKAKWKANREGWKRVFIYLQDALYEDLKKISKVEGEGNLSGYTRRILRDHVLSKKEKKL